MNDFEATRRFAFHPFFKRGIWEDFGAEKIFGALQVCVCVLAGEVRIERFLAELK